MIPLHDDVALGALRRQLRLDPEPLRQLRNAFYKKRLPAEKALERLPLAQRSAFAEAVAFHTLTVHSRHDSQLDGASKLIFQTAAGKLLESVILRIQTGRTTLCVSSQVGCAVRCGFCATGQMGRALDLGCDEILDQIVQANQLLRAEERGVRNVVFMGMGEPLHNEDAVALAIETIVSPRAFGLAPAHVLVSTVGIPEAMVRFARRFPDVGIALSLHSARQAVREKIIPLARRYPLPVLREAILEATTIQGKPPMIEYLLLAGVNDTDADLQALLGYLGELPAHVNLIPYNAIAGVEFVGTSEGRRNEFAAGLTSAGFRVTIRHSLGRDVAAACGQLVQRQLLVGKGTA